jgi:paraquat-inducible protein A
MTGQLSHTARSRGLVSCHTCGMISRTPPESGATRCPRCGCRLHERIPASLSRSWAFLVAAIVLYVPANLLPMMHLTSFGQVQSDTILSGVVYLLVHDMWPLALIVFVASIVVPVVKIIIMAYLLTSVQLSSVWRPLDRARLYRFTEFVGRWSMIDVFVVTLLVALVHLGQVAQVEAGSGALFFAAVVVLTMLAAMSFDPRLIWDRADG